MLFKRKFFINPSDGEYKGRNSIFNKINSYQDLLSWCLIKSPHTILNIGYALKNFSGTNLNENAISIGCDPVKEWLLISEIGLFNSVKVYDIDCEFVNLGNIFFRKHDVNISYECENVTCEDFEFDSQYKTLLLFQMDYIFSDKDLVNILTKFSKNGNECYIITPSLFNFSKSHIQVVYYDLLASSLFILHSLYLNLQNKYKGASDHAYYYQYKRTNKHFENIFNRCGFFVTNRESYVNPNGSFNLYRFESK